MDALRSVLPAGTLSGAPKVRAMQIIDELEPVKRGGYGGAIGYLSYARRPRHRDPHPHGRRQGRRRARAGGRRHRRRRQAGLRVRGVGREGARRDAGDRARRRAAATGHEGPRHRQLRLVHLQPRPVPRRAGRGGRGRCATTARPSTSCSRAATTACVVSPGPVHARRGRHLARGRPRACPRRASRRSASASATRRSRQAFGGQVMLPPAGARQDDDDRARRPHDLPRPAVAR